MLFRLAIQPPLQLGQTWPAASKWIVDHTLTYVQLMLGVQFNKRTVLQQLCSAALRLRLQWPQQLLSIISHVSTDVLLWLIYHKSMYQHALELQHGTPDEALPSLQLHTTALIEHVRSDAHRIQVQQVSTCALDFRSHLNAIPLMLIDQLHQDDSASTTEMRYSS
jgi:hypothetical protein